MGATEALTTRVLQPKTIISSGIKTPPRTFEKRVLHQKYTLEKRSLRQIAAEFSSSKTAIRQALRKFDIPLRDSGKNPHRLHNLAFGTRCVKGKTIDHQGEQKAIRSILKMHKEGLSNCAIARVLTEMKVPTKQQGKKWHYETVRQILMRHRAQT